MSAAQLTYAAATKTLVVTQTAGSVFQVRKEDDVLSVIVDNTQIVGNAFSLTMTLNLVDQPGANNWSGTGTLVFTDTGAANVVEAAVQTNFITMWPGNVFVVNADLTDLGANTSILVGSNPWVFNGQSEIGAEPTEGVANQITILHPENYDSGDLWTVKFSAPNVSLDELFRVDRALSAGEVKGEVVPVPAAVLLGLLGLGAAGVKLRRLA